MTDAPAPPTIDPEQLDELMTLLHGSDTVELKLTIPDGDQRSAVRSLEMDPLDAEVRQVFFFDTPDLALNKHGVIVRARRTATGDDSVVKLRPVVPSEIDADLRSLKGFGVEVDAMPGGFVCSGRLRAKMHPGKVKEVVAGKRPLRSLFDKKQRAFFAECAPPGISLDELTILGPIMILKLKFSPVGTTAGSWPSSGCTRTALASWSCPPRPRRPTRSRWPRGSGSSSSNAASISPASSRRRPRQVWSSSPPS